MKSFYQHLILLAGALLFSGMAGGLLQKSVMQTDGSVPAASKVIENAEARPGGRYYPLAISEETGRTMVPRPRTVQW